MKVQYLTVLAAGAVLLFAGCQNTVNTVENAEKNMTQNIVSDKRFVTDAFLSRRLQLKQVITSKLDGIMQVQVAAVNTRTGVAAQAWSGITNENPYKIDYKFVWLNQAGMAMETPLSNWRTVTVYPGQTVQFGSAAPSPDCNDFILNLKESK